MPDSGGNELSLTSEQLQNARAERWRQSSNPILTAEDAQAWLDGVGFCLFLPRRVQFSVPAPSFVEAVVGSPSDAPAREAVENASSLLHRLVTDGSVAPLNLFGHATFGNGVAGASDQPDFLVARSALPYVFSLIGGRNWKSGPGAKVSPLVLEIWKQLDGAGAQTAAEIQSALGRELTEAAALRGLVELWHGLRAIPVSDGGTTRWELTQARFAAEMTASQKVAQTTALSALVSLYLESAVAASSEEIETFLSPLTSRSRVREVVNGLSATRQLGLVSIGAQPLMHVAGSLPEFEEEEPAKAEPRPAFERRPPFQKREGGFERAPRPREREDRGRGGPRPERREGTGFGRPDAGRFAARGEGASGAKGERPYRKPDDRRPADRERKPFGKKPFDRGARPSGSRPFDRERPSGGGGKFPPRKFGPGGAKPWQERGERAAGSQGERPSRPRREDERGGERRSSGFGGAEKSGEKRFGPKKYGGPKFGAGKKFGGPRFGARSGSGPRAGSFGPRSEDPRPSSSRPSGSRPYSRPAGGERSASSGGFKRDKPGEKRPFFRERPAKDGESRGRGFKPRTGEGARPAKRADEWKPKAAGGAFQKSGGSFGKSGKPGFKSGKPPFKREGGAGFKKAGNGKAAKPFGKSDKPFGKSSSTGGKSGKPFGKSGKPFQKSPRPSGGPASRGPRPGGFKPPFRKRKKEEGGSGE